MMLKTKDDKIFIFGSRGMVGSALERHLLKKNYKNIYTDKIKKDLRIKNNVFSFLKKKQPDIVILCAAKVGGIWENNQFPYDFLLDNLSIQNNVISACQELKIKNFVFLGSSCVYPISNNRLKEELLLKSKLEETNQWYAIAKISGLKLCEALNKQYDYDFRCFMPTNLFGYNDNYKGKKAHVIPALIEKFQDALEDNSKCVYIWGSGNVKREFMFVDDLASAIVKSLKVSKKKFQKVSGKSGLLNIGSNQEMSIKHLANKIKKVTNFQGELIFQKNKLEGVKRKILDTTKLKKIVNISLTPFDHAIKLTYEDYIKTRNK